MGLLDKLKFWGKKDDDIGPELGGPMHDTPAALPGEGGGGADYGLGPEPGKPGAMGMEGMPGMEEKSLGERSGIGEKPMGISPGIPEHVSPAHTPPGTPITSATREMEVINLKLDSIRNTLENINIRLERIEKLARGEHEKKIW